MAVDLPPPPPELQLGRTKYRNVPARGQCALRGIQAPERFLLHKMLLLNDEEYSLTASGAANYS